MKPNLLSVLTMRVPNRSLLAAVAFNVVYATLIIRAIELDLFGWVLGIIVVFEAYRIWVQGEGFAYHAIAQSSFWLVSLSLPMILLLNPRRASELVLGVLFVAWRLVLRSWHHETEKALIMAAVTQFACLFGIFSAAAFYRWPGIVIISLTWFSSWVIARRLLETHGERASAALSSTWALIVAECSWIFSLWLITYILPGGFANIPQPAIVLTALGYCLAGIYSAHRNSKLTRGRLVEYLIVGLLLMGIVIAGTKWNGVI